MKATARTGGRGARAGAGQEALVAAEFPAEDSIKQIVHSPPRQPDTAGCPMEHSSSGPTAALRSGGDSTLTEP